VRTAAILARAVNWGINWGIRRARVVFMKWVPGTERYKAGDGPEVDDYDAGVAKQRKYRRRKLSNLDNSKRAGDFDESEHPRDEGSKFTDKGGGDQRLPSAPK
jgi:hypothetical protein